MDRDSRISLALKVAALSAISILLLVAVIQALRLLGTNGIVILASILVVYLIAPVVSLFRRRMPLALALTLTYVLVAMVVVIAFVAIVPPLLTQARSLIDALPPMLATLQRELANPHSALLKDIPPNLRTYLTTVPAQINSLAAKYGLGVAQATIGAFFSIVTLFMSIIVVPIFSAYVFFDAPEIKAGFMGLVPAGARPRTLAILADLNTTIGDFVRGQVLDGLILGTMIAVMLAIMHVPYALLIGVAAGILNLIPYLGAIIGFIPSVLLAWIFNGWENALIVAILFGVIQQIDGNFIMPRIMKNSVRLSPLIIIAAILIFSSFFGIVGTFLAVPLAAMLRVFKLHLAPAIAPAEMAVEESQAAPLELVHTSN